MRTRITDRSENDAGSDTGAVGNAPGRRTLTQSIGGGRPLQLNSAGAAPVQAKAQGPTADPFDFHHLAGGGVLDQTPSSGSGTPAPPTSTSAVRPTVDKIDLITSSSGATTGYPAITSGDLNAPGPFNNAATGAVNNVLQVKFHLDHGASSALTPRREIQRTATMGTTESKNPPDRPPSGGGSGPPTPGGFAGVIVGPDGPGAHEILRPTSDTIVIADAPGIGALSASQYPFSYLAHFTVKVVDAIGDVAQCTYDVRIRKISATDIPNAENSAVATGKTVFVRGRSIP